MRLSVARLFITRFDRRKVKMKRLVKVITAAVLVMACVFALVACNANGGEFDASKNITVITRQDGSGTKTAFMKLSVLKARRTFPA